MDTTLLLCSPLQRNRVDVAAVVRLLAMNRAAIAEEALVGIGVETEIVDHQNAGGFQSLPDQSGEIEHGVAFAQRWHEEHCVVRVRLDEARHELVADLVAVLADQR